MDPQRRDTALASLALATSLGTLVCCTLPVVLVTLGAGAVMAGLITAVPQIVVLSENKAIVFAVAGVLLALAWAARHATRNAPCPIDPKEADACRRLRQISGALLAISAAVYAIGFGFAYLAPALII